MAELSIRKHSHRCAVLAYKRERGRDPIDKEFMRRPACDCGADHENVAEMLREVRGSLVDTYAMIACHVPDSFSNALRVSLDAQAALLDALDAQSDTRSLHRWGFEGGDAPTLGGAPKKGEAT